MSRKILACHPERSALRQPTLSRIIGAESKDRDNVSGSNAESRRSHKQHRANSLNRHASGRTSGSFDSPSVAFAPSGLLRMTDTNDVIFFAP